ncbi:MAG TPA: potassium transporter Kup [Steroidobacteraceae bacterium]|nr:potassium transporter Kup [Steroidobacteraceae bacterium]
MSAAGSGEANGLPVERYGAGPGHGGPLHVLALGALGVVFGDIGTSPLYAFKTCLTAVGPLGTAPAAVLGVLSLIFWAITLVVTVKYVGLVLRADNRGEGGVLALTALVVTEGRARFPVLLAALGLAGCAFFYGDGTITPAVSVLSAIEGLEIANQDLAEYVVPLSVAVLLVLFAVQRRGTGSIGGLFGPVMLVWFLVIAALGVVQIAGHPEVLLAVNPAYAVLFLLRHPAIGGTVLAAVFLAVTGGEALYADLGHFGRRPIRLVWYGLVWPSLTLNYFGQGALVLGDAAAADNPFYLLAPDRLLIPLVVLATAATIIASQAVISGVFSMTQQALQLGFLPRMKVSQTSATSIGQIYVPVVNAILCAATVGLVLYFRSSERLANAYGIAVVCTMLITALLLDVLLKGRGLTDVRSRWLLALALPLGAIDLVFLSSNIEKIPHGGFFPLLFGLAVFVTMRTWMRGRAVVSEQMRRQERPVKGFLEELGRQPPQQVPGTAVFLTSNSDAVPRTLARNVRYNGVLHEHTVLMSVVTERIPRVPRGGRLKVSRLAPQLWRVEAHVGFMERPNVPKLLREAERLGLGFRTDNATYFLGRDDVVVASPRGMARWRKSLFLFLSRNAEFAGAHFGIPPERIIELGGQVQI